MPANATRTPVQQVLFAGMFGLLGICVADALTRPDLDHADRSVLCVLAIRMAYWVDEA